MKILITTDLFAIQTNGVVTSVKNLLNELEQKGHEVRVLTFSNDRHSHREENVYYLGSASIGFIYPNVRMPFSYRNSMVKELIEWKPDVIHSQCEFFSYQYAERISRLTKAPIVHTYHTLYEQYVGYVTPFHRFGAGVMAQFSKNRLKRAKRIIAPTYKVKKALLGYGVKSPITVLPSGIDLEQHKTRISPEYRNEKRQALGIPADAKVLLNLGRLGEEKNIDELLFFFQKALATRKDLFFLIVGDGPAKEKLEKEAKKLGISQNVCFAGMVDPKEVQEYDQLGDLFVNASTSETQGLTYIEAAANGLPLLCREDLCLKNVLLPNENGYFYTNESDFLEALNQLLDDAEQCKRMSEKSIAVASRFDKRAFGSKVEKIYRSVLQ
jgi:1,2-diacylglycerol 3-alpha-glucosyltransferase